MVLSFSSLASTLFFNSVALIILYFIVRSKALVLRTSIFYLFLCMFLALFRPILPLEFSFTKTIPIEKIWPEIYRFLHEPLFFIADIEFSFITISIIVWIIGGIAYCLRIVLAYIILYHRIKRMQPCNDILILETLNKINSEYKKRISFQLVISDESVSPFVFGIYRPYIVLPSIELSPNEWYYILSHEVTHYHQGDLVKKAIIELLSAVFWWNPFLHMIKKRMNNIMEIYIDSVTTQSWSNEMKIGYMDCIVKLARVYEANILRSCKKAVIYNFTSDFSISQRVDFLINSVTCKYKPTINIGILMFLLLLFILITPSFYVFEPSSMRPEHAEGAFTINSNNAYFIINDEGTYDIYLYDEYLYTLNEPSIEGLVIYNQKGEKVR